MEEDHVDVDYRQDSDPYMKDSEPNNGLDNVSDSEESGQNGGCEPKAKKGNDDDDPDDDEATKGKSWRTKVRLLFMIFISSWLVGRRLWTGRDRPYKGKLRNSRI